MSRAAKCEVDMRDPKNWDGLRQRMAERKALRLPLAKVERWYPDRKVAK